LHKKEYHHLVLGKAEDVLILSTIHVQVVTELLCEMNSDVRGTARVANFRNVFQTG
jgi:hypothetical protein